MPKKRLPKYCHHKATGQARVRIDGKDVYLGTYNSPESHRRYAVIITEWQQAGNCPRGEATFGELSMMYLKQCEKHYRKNGKLTSEYGLIRYALRWMNKVARNVPLAELSPRHLKQSRELMVNSGMTRGTVNKFVQRIRRAVKWAVGEELCSANVLVGLQAVPDLRRGRSDAPDNDPVKPVPEAFIEAIQPHVTRQVWGMIQFQRLTGARPGEARIVRGRDLDTSGTIWIYRPESHKTQHHGKERVICIGETGQVVMREFLLPDLGAYIFGAEPDAPYHRCAYATAIYRGCKAADVPRWSPNQLRHNFATRARREFGIEAARVTLGHSSAVTSEIYAERDIEAARAVVAKIG